MVLTNCESHRYYSNFRIIKGDVGLKGFFDKVLRMNLKNKSFEKETIPDSVYENYLWGKDLGTHLLMKVVPANYIQPHRNGGKQAHIK